MECVGISLIRARLNLGDYYFDASFDGEIERIKAETLLPKVAGPSFSEILERQRPFIPDNLPLHQA